MDMDRMLSTHGESGPHAGRHRQRCRTAVSSSKSCGGVGVGPGLRSATERGVTAGEIEPAAAGQPHCGQATHVIECAGGIDKSPTWTRDEHTLGTVMIL